jgi:N-acetylglucosaminyldiphosphoundecaprenol N-acetyl-beta-D-mannosaminyltransferase
LDVVGTYSPPYRDLTESEIEDVAQMLNDSGADIVWIGLSTPKQERLMDSLRPMVKASALIGVGAAFDIHAGNIKQAPQWMRGSGLEWLFRLTVEPRRLWRRYLRSNPRFVWSILRNRPRMVLTEAPKD